MLTINQWDWHFSFIFSSCYNLILPISDATFSITRKKCWQSTHLAIRHMSSSPNWNLSSIRVSGWVDHHWAIFFRVWIATKQKQSGNCVLYRGGIAPLWQGWQGCRHMFYLSSLEVFWPFSLVFCPYVTGFCPLCNLFLKYVKPQVWQLPSLPYWCRRLWS